VLTLMLSFMLSTLLPSAAVTSLIWLAATDRRAD